MSPRWRPSGFDRDGLERGRLGHKLIEHFVNLTKMKVPSAVRVDLLGSLLKLFELAQKQHLLVVADEVMSFRSARGERTGIRTT